jgi:hypothetical protein
MSLERWLLSRAEFLVSTGSAFVVSKLSGQIVAVGPPDCFPDPSQANTLLAPTTGSMTWLELVRPGDLLRVAIGYSGFSATPHAGILHRTQQEAYLGIALPGQHLKEPVFEEKAANNPSSWGPGAMPGLHLAYANPTVLVVRAASGGDVDLTVDAILAEFAKTVFPSLDGATSPATPVPTAVESVFRLLLAPSNAKIFYASLIAPSESNIRGFIPPTPSTAYRKYAWRPVWHASVVPALQTAAALDLLAYGSRNPTLPNCPNSDPMGIPQSGDEPINLTANDRAIIVSLSSAAPHQYVKSDLLVLSSLGATQRLAFHDSTQTPGTCAIGSILSDWRVRTTVGRDQHSLKTFVGFLYPYGHRAIYTLEADREVVDGVAYLVGKRYITLVDQEVSYASSNTDRSAYHAGATVVRIVTHQTPNIDEDAVPGTRPGATPAPSPNAFVCNILSFTPLVKDSSTEFLFDIERVDHDGQRVRSREPLIFVDKEFYGFTLAQQQAFAEVLLQFYSKPSRAHLEALAFWEGNRPTQVGDLVRSGNSCLVCVGFKPQPGVPIGVTGEIDLSADGYEPGKLINDGAIVWRKIVLCRNEVLLFKQQLSLVQSIGQAQISAAEACAKHPEAAGCPVSQLRPAALEMVKLTLKPYLTANLARPDIDTFIARVPDIRRALGQDLLAQLRVADQLLNTSLPLPEITADAVFADVVDELIINFQDTSAQLEQRAKSGIANLKSYALGLSRYNGVLQGAKDGKAQILNAFHNFAGQLTQIKAEDIVPANLFPNILGIVSLYDLLRTYVFTPDQFPKLHTPSAEVSAEITTSYAFNSRLNPNDTLKAKGGGSPDPTVSFKAAMTVSAAASAEAGGAGANATSRQQLYCSLQNAKLSLFGLIELPFDEITFTYESGKGSHTAITGMNEIALIGNLSFLNNIESFLKDFLGEGPIIEVGTEAIAVGWAFNIGTIGMGVFSLQNVNFDVSAALPIVDRPLEFVLGLADKANPFVISAGILGGGGYVQLTFSGTSLALSDMDVSMEFGATVAISLGPAGGDVHIFAGIHMHRSADSFIVGGFFNAGGHMGILGLITADVQFYIELSYDGNRGVIHGEATWSIDIHIGFFSVGVTLTMSREFPVHGGGSVALAARQPYAVAATGMAQLGPAPTYQPHSPSFDDLTCGGSWQTYCNAFR